MAHTLLLVDDDPHVLAALRRALRRASYRLLCADSAQQALEILAATPVDLVVSDHVMPGTQGTTLLATVRQRYPDTVRFMLTGQPALEVALSAINDGAITRFFTKPCNPVELSLAIRDALRQKDLLVEARRLLDLSQRQSAALEALEREHPGISALSEDASGRIVLEPVAADDAQLVAEMERHITTAVQQLRRVRSHEARAQSDPPLTPLRDSLPDATQPPLAHADDTGTGRVRGVLDSHAAPEADDDS